MFQLFSLSSLLTLSPSLCRNMSGHSRWAVQPLDWRRWYSKINSYAVVVLYTKDDDFPCNGCYFLVYQFRKCVDTRVFLTEIVYLESHDIQRMTPHTNISSQESYQSILSRTLSTIIPLTSLFQQNRPTDIIVAVGSSHIIVSTL